MSVTVHKIMIIISDLIIFLLFCEIVHTFTSVGLEKNVQMKQPEKEKSLAHNSCSH